MHDEYVLLGNAGLLRCLIPSFVSDFVIVDTWVGDDGTHITADSHGIDSKSHQPKRTARPRKRKNKKKILYARILAVLSLDPSGNAGMKENGHPHTNE